MEATTMKLGIANIYTVAHIAGVETPRTWRAREVGRWLLALCLHRDGRTDAARRAAEILPDMGLARIESDTRYARVDLVSLRERATIALAMWEAKTGPIGWSVDEIALGFGFDLADTNAYLGHAFREMRDGLGPDCRKGISDVRSIVGRALKARVS